MSSTEALLPRSETAIVMDVRRYAKCCLHVAFAYGLWWLVYMVLFGPRFEHGEVGLATSWHCAIWIQAAFFMQKLFASRNSLEASLG